VFKQAVEDQILRTDVKPGGEIGISEGASQIPSPAEIEIKSEKRIGVAIGTGIRCACWLCRTAVTDCETLTGVLQQEWLPVAISQLPAIFLQQAISASLMLGVGKHASNGAAAINKASTRIGKRRGITSEV
jgi:hypothetical protein